MSRKAVKAKKGRFVISMTNGEGKVKVDISLRQYRLLHLTSVTKDEAIKAVGRLSASQGMRGLVKQGLASETRVGTRRTPWGTKVLKALQKRGEKI